MTTEKILDQRMVKLLCDEHGTAVEWHLVETLRGTEWKPRIVSLHGDVLLELQGAPLPGAQSLFLSCPLKVALWFGERGSGGTTTLLQDFAREVGKGYGSNWRGLLLRKDVDGVMALTAAAAQFYSAIFPGVKILRAKSEAMVVFPSKETLIIRPYPELAFAYHGHEYPAIYFDCLDEFSQAEFEQLSTVCRPTQDGIPTRIRATATDELAVDCWVGKYFEVPHNVGRVLYRHDEPARVSIRGTLAENFILLHSAPRFPEWVRGWKLLRKYTHDGKNFDAFAQWASGNGTAKN